MGTVVLLVSLALFGVFGLAGVAKLVDLRGSRAAVRGFGAPDAVADAIGAALPIVELAIAGALLFASSRWWAAVSAVALLAVFCCAIGVAMVRGRRPACHCFGQLHSEPVGWRTLARNCVLAALAAVVVAAGRHAPGPSVFAWSSRLDASGWAVVALGVVAVALIALGTLTVVHVLRSYGRVLVRLERVEDRLRAVGIELDEPEDMLELGIEPGTEAPAFALDSLSGDRVDLAALLEPARPLLLLFTSPTCGPCSVLMPTVSQWQAAYADALTVGLLSHGDETAIRAEATEHGLEHVLLDRDGAVSRAYEANGTPSAVLVNPDGTIASWLAAGCEWIESLVEQAIRGAGASGLPIGSELPSASLATPDGTEIALTDTVAGSTVLLFWHPGCGFCRSMHEDIRAWEADRPVGAPALVVISAGTAEEVRVEGFKSKVLLDPEWSASTALGADGTPMAVLVGQDGRIASSLVTGAAAVLELLAVGDLAPVR